MYKIKIKSQKNNRKTAKTQVTVDCFDTIETAQAFINKCVVDQYRKCMRGWGLTALDTAQPSETEYTALYQSACLAFDCTALRVDFTIIPA